MRIHLKPADFLLFVNEIRTAGLQYNKYRAKNINIKQISYHPVVDKYIEILKEYDTNGDKFDISRSGEIDSFLTIKEIGVRSPSLGLKRPNGLPTDVPGKIPDKLDTLHLLKTYESFKKYGYAQGPYQYNYIRIYLEKDGTIKAKDSHRLACLLHLGYSDIKAMVVESESGWTECSSCGK